MNISQRQATIAVLGFQLAAMIILFLTQLWLSGLADPLTLGAGIALLIYGSMLFAYLRGWEYARHTSVVLITVVVAVFLPEPFVTMYAPFLILLGPILALVLVNPLWVVGSAIATIGLLLLRAGGSGVYANLETLLNYAMLIAGLVVSRVIVETAHAHSKKAEESYRALVENTLEGMGRATLDGKMLAANPALVRLNGYDTEAELISAINNIASEWYVDSDRRAEFLRILEESGEVKNFESEIYRHKTRERIWISESARLVRNAEGRPLWLEATIQNITERKRAEEALATSEKRFRALVENSSDTIALVDSVGSILYASPAATRILGYTIDEYVGQNALELIHPEDAQEAANNLAKTFQQSGIGVFFQTRQRHKDGSWRWLEGTATNLLNEPSVQAIVVNYRDITERKQAEEKLERQNQRLKALREIDTAILAADSVENIVDVALDHIRELIDCHRAVVGLFDFEANEWVVFNVRGVGEIAVPKQSRIPLSLYEDKLIQTLSKDQPLLIDDLSALSDSPPQVQTLIKAGLRSQCILPLFSQGALIGLFGLSSKIVGFFDEDRISLGREIANQIAIAITQNNLLNALRESNAELQARAIEREQLIVEMSAKNAELESFTYTVSHDLKSPLVTMKGFLGYLEQDAMTGNVERLKRDIQRISNAVDKMQTLLKDLLELSRIGRFINPPEVIPFEELARSAIGLVGGQIQERRITVELQPGLPVVYGDRQRLTVVLQNLFDNAAKYMGDQLEPHIKIGQRGQADGELIFFVHDNGIGIAPEYHERIFGLFNKLDA
ncbi:MAG: PAS domain S-box protein, partial [Chloroflexota bacterium]